MAKLKDFLSIVNDGKKVVLFLPKGHQKNLERENLKIFVWRENNRYVRKLRYTDRPLPTSPDSLYYDSWDKLLSAHLEPEIEGWEEDQVFK